MGRKKINPENFVNVTQSPKKDKLKQRDAFIWCQGRVNLKGLEDVAVEQIKGVNEKVGVGNEALVKVYNDKTAVVVHCDILNARTGQCMAAGDCKKVLEKQVSVMDPDRLQPADVNYTICPFTKSN